MSSLGEAFISIIHSINHISMQLLTFCMTLTLVSVTRSPFSPFCQSHTEIIFSGESSIAVRREPPSARLKEMQLTEPVNSPAPITATVAKDTEFHTLMWG